MSPFNSRDVGLSHDPDLPPDTRYSAQLTADWILDELSQPKYREPFCTGLLAGLIRGQRHAQNLYARMFKLIGAEKELALVVIQQLGVRDPEEAKKFIDAGRQYERLKLETSMDPQDAMNDGLDSLKFALSQRPEWRAKIVRELGGVMPEVNGDG